MSPRRAARSAVVCTLIFGVAIARAQPVRRPVAVIDLADTRPNETLAQELNSELNNHLDLKPVDNTYLIPLLSGSLLDEDGSYLTRARNQKQEAEDAVGAYRFAQAVTTAEEALRRLELATPSPAVLGVYAEVSFILGAARLGDRKPDKAADAFRLAHSVNPAFKPDPIRYVPEVVQAYETAIKVTPPLGKIDLAGTGRAIIDGREAGVAPGWFDATAGTHVVWLVDADRLPRAKQVFIIAGRKERIEIEDAKATLEVKVQRARLALKLAPDPAARSSAMQQLAALLEVKDAVLLTSVNGKTVVQTWADKAPGFSALRERKDEKAIDIIAPLLPPKVVIIPPPKTEEPPRKPIVVDTRSWYEKPRYQISGGVAIGVAIVAVLIVYSRWQDSREIGSDSEAGFRFGGSR